VRARACTIAFRGAYEFSSPPEAMWTAIEHSERFEGWWWWLGEFRLDGRGLVPGAVLHGRVSPPVPYQMQVHIHLEVCEAPYRIDAAVAGDLVGPAHLRLSPSGAGTLAEVDWALEMMQRPMRMAARVASPLLRFGHDRVVEATVRGLPPEFGYRGGRGRHL
jgi:hypothetical protein